MATENEAIKSITAAMENGAAIVALHPSNLVVIARALTEFVSVVLKDPKADKRDREMAANAIEMLPMIDSAVQSIVDVIRRSNDEAPRVSLSTDEQAPRAQFGFGTRH